MTEQTTKIKIFVASPGDVPEERQQLFDVVKEINSTIGREKKIILELVRWETDCFPCMGRPQGEINKQIGNYDIFIGIMWKRFGTPTGKAESGTEEEFRHAYSIWSQHKIPHILFYFCKTPFMPDNRDEIEQIGKVVDFREELSKIGLTWDYTDRNNFANIVRPHLLKIISKKFKQQPDEGSINLLHQNWNNLDPNLQDAFALAYNETRRQGKVKIQTRTLFAALVKLSPEPLNDLLKLIPTDALPTPINENSADKEYILKEEPCFSGCVTESLDNLKNQTSTGKKFSPEDVFVDIARHGVGTSVRRLRKHKITQEKINELVTQLGWKVIDRPS